MASFDHHLFICGNQRPGGHPRGCCDPGASESLQQAFKKALAERGLSGRIRANKSGCLDQCEHGPVVVIYPEALWYGGVTAADIPDIIHGLVNGRPVDRLRLADACVNTETCDHKPRTSV